MKEYAAADLRALIETIREVVQVSPSPDTPLLYLIGNTSHLAEGWRERVARFELGGEPGGTLELAVREASRALGLPVVWETPADVIPLSPGWAERARPASSLDDASHPFQVVHFDPYSVVLRLVARGDEPDYLAALEYLRHGWVEVAQLEELLGELLLRFTSATLAQDPAEFRRKFRGLRQLSASVA
ncbi:MAG TPA: hypothetical protein VMH88_06435 [Gemmatimonadales bacterium]|nr:hypothetical protein [Gemmatimonadales bacterium]